MEMLFSGRLSKGQVERVVRYRETHRDILLGIPAAYGYNSGEVAGFLSYGHAYGLLQHDFVREFLLLLYSLSAHQYTRGAWTAPETRRLDPHATAAPYCVPAQLCVPLLLKWMLVFEDPNAEVLWLCKAIPRDWLHDGVITAVTSAPTRWGKVSFRIQSRLAENRIEATLLFPKTASAHATILRLRAPDGCTISGVLLDGEPWSDFDPEQETVTLPSRPKAKVVVTVNYK